MKVGKCSVEEAMTKARVRNGVEEAMTKAQAQNDGEEYMGEGELTILVLNVRAFLLKSQLVDK